MSVELVRIARFLVASETIPATMSERPSQAQPNPNRTHSADPIWSRSVVKEIKPARAPRANGRVAQTGSVLSLPAPTPKRMDPAAARSNPSLKAR